MVGMRRQNVLLIGLRNLLKLLLLQKHEIRHMLSRWAEYILSATSFVLVTLRDSKLLVRWAFACNCLLLDRCGVHRHLECLREAARVALEYLPFSVRSFCAKLILLLCTYWICLILALYLCHGPLEYSGGTSSDIALIVHVIRRT